MKTKQRGVVLYVALVVVIAMMLAGVALLRSVGTGAGVAGNLAFKQNATMAADRGTEAAMAWLVAQAGNTAILQTNNPAGGYFAVWDASFNPHTFDWNGNEYVKQAGDVDATGNRVRYVIHRLCNNTGSTLSSASQQCTTTDTDSKYGDSGSAISTGALQRALYRVTSRVDGPRGTTSIVQVMVY